jgi:glycosyltransferase involved in cell wall biosynthesis
MRIGFDAKRAFFNRSGLGSYSRDTISIVSTYFQNEEYILYTPRINNAIHFPIQGNSRIVVPESFLSRNFSSTWRTAALASRLIKDKLDVYHGLSHELPLGIRGHKIQTVLTIHDLIFLRYPKFYSFPDRLIYLAKFRYSCHVADRIIAISEQTKRDIIHFFGTPETKIEVVYQGCNPRYYESIPDAEKARMQKKYNLPSDYILCVATIEDRKNQSVILKALQAAKLDIPVVLVGKEKEYSLKVREYISANRVKNVYFTGQVPAEDLPGIYQNALLFVYPSLFEGFGIPILEALNSGVPVISSAEGCFPEAGGPSSMYADITNPEELGNAIHKVISDSSLREKMIAEGYIHAANFREEKIASNLMRVYQHVMNR